MKGYIQTCLLALAAVALGQTGLGDLPDCAKTCAANLPPECNLADIKCYCSSSSWIQTLSCCVKNSCAGADQATTIQVASNLCQLAGVTLPTVASCPASSIASTTAAAASSASSTAGSSVTGAQTATTASRSSASSATQISSSSASAAASATGTSSRSATSATNSATSASSAGAASASPSHAAAAGHFLGQGLSAAGAAAFAFALL